MNPAVFLDRDGVINRVVLRDGRPFPPASADDLEILPRVPEAIAAMRLAGYRIIVVTNQPDVATGVQRREVVEAFHERLRGSLEIDDVRVCFHTDSDGCSCRKPKPGMLLDAAESWHLDLSRSWMVGDRWRDIEAGKAAGCKTILVRGSYSERHAEDPDTVVDSLHEASVLVLSGAPAATADGRAGGDHRGGDPW